MHKLIYKVKHSVQIATRSLNWFWTKSLRSKFPSWQLTFLQALRKIQWPPQRSYLIFTKCLFLREPHDNERLTDRAMRHHSCSMRWKLMLSTSLIPLCDFSMSRRSFSRRYVPWSTGIIPVVSLFTSQQHFCQFWTSFFGLQMQFAWPFYADKLHRELALLTVGQFLMENSH